MNGGSAFDQHRRGLPVPNGLLPVHITTPACSRPGALLDNFARQVALHEIQHRNETLFYAMINQGREAIIHTPATGRTCQRFSPIRGRPRLP